MSPIEQTELKAIVADAVKQEVEPLHQRLSAIEEHLTGGKSPHRGIHVRLDRLERESVQRGKIVGWIATSTIAVIVATIWNLIRGH